jgi:outer membrane protein assembly factor BamD
MIKRIFLCLLIATWLGFTGCSFFETKKLDLPAKELAEAGMSDFEKGNYTDAVKNFERLRDWYPFNQLAILAELKIADANYNLKNYDEAISAYGDFENLHPKNEAVPYCVYKIGMSYYSQVDTVDRDQSMARKALETFDRLIKTYPDDEYSEKAGVYRKKCLKSLAGHELYVAKFYLKDDQYKAALRRFEGIIKNYPDVGIHTEALHYIGMLKEKMNNTE